MNKDEVNIEKENANTANEIAENNGPTDKVPSPKRYRTRSSVSGLGVTLTDTNAQMQRKSRSAAEPRPKPQFIDYKGKVEYYTEFHDIAFASDTLL